MGGIIDLPTEAEPFGAEVRRESFYISTSPDELVLTAATFGDEDTDIGQVGVPVDHLPAFVVALEAVAATAVARVGRRGEPVVWKVAREGREIVIGGRMCVFGVGAERRPVQTVELLYVDLPGLLEELHSVPGSGRA